MKKAIPFLMLVIFAAVGCSGPEGPTEPAPKFGSDAGPRQGGQAPGGAPPAQNTAPKGSNAEFGG